MFPIQELYPARSQSQDYPPYFNANLLSFYNAYGDNEARRAFEEALVRLHNKGAIDAMSVLAELSRETNRGRDFFRVQHVFEAVLPELDADVAKSDAR